MQTLDGTLIFSATDLVGHLACEHLTQLERKAAHGQIARPSRSDPELDLLTRRGKLHERRYLESLRAASLQITEIKADRSSATSLRAAAEATLEAMRSGVDVVYQGVLFDGTWVGFADFLTRVERSSTIGPFSYEVADTKLARRVKPGALLQLCAYSELLTALQGVEPERIHVVLGGADIVTFRVSELAAYYRVVKRLFEEAATGPVIPTYPDPVEHCSICRWLDVCQKRRTSDDHLSLVANMRRDQTRKLNAVGIETVADLLASLPATRVAGVGIPTLERLRSQARLQVEQRKTGSVIYELLEPEAGRGLVALTAPSPGDLFFDMEGDPHFENAGLEYLFGVLEPTEVSPRYHAFWAHDRAEEKAAFQGFIDLVMDRLDRQPDLHVYHYAAYETSTLARLAGVYATRERELDRLLRGGVFVDLFQVVRQGVRVSQEFYSLKALEPLYMAARSGEVRDATSSIVKYEDWVDTGEASLLEEIRVYNEEDCLSTFRLRDWLEQRRDELARRLGRTLERPAPREAAPSEAQAEAEGTTQELVRALTERLPKDPKRQTIEEQAQWLLAQLLEWHRREARSEWRMYLLRCEISDEDLVEDHEAIGLLEYAGEAGSVKRSIIHRYIFEPQDNKIFERRDVHDPRTKKNAGWVHRIDNEFGVLELLRGKGSKTPHPRSVIPESPRPTTEQREALARIAGWVLNQGLDAPGPYRAVRDLLLRRGPRLAGASPREALVRDGELPQDAARRLVGLLDEGCLPIQGPPGSGKTYSGAQMVLDLVHTGRVVGITAPSHKVIGNLLDEVCSCASKVGVRLRALQKAQEHERCRSEIVKCVNDNQEVATALDEGRIDVVAGTSWLFVRPEMEGRFHTLFVDEAGQMSLANVVAMGGTTRNVVLLGDPRQLPQPLKGCHPRGADLSALEHVLEDRLTISPSEGIFLELTHRLHPDVCEFISTTFYEGRLKPQPSCIVQELSKGGPWGGTGLRYVAVEHEGNRSTSLEEVDRVREIVDGILGNAWTNREGQTRPIKLEDILVVAPYNAQVAALGKGLPGGSRVGTVDKFQGQEAPVVIYSMATSSAEDLPRNMEFLFSLNRLNVAVSRAQGLAVLVCSPRLLEVRCRTPEQMRLANALCRFVEMARPIA
jgi:uncharacterized protein